MEDVKRLTALQLGKALRAGELSIPEVTALALEEARCAGDNAFITLTEERAMERAEALQQRRGGAEGPLYGVPMALKDNVCTKDVPTTCASRMLENFVPSYDAAVVEQLVRAGGVSIGKTNMDEFAMGSTSETSFFGPVLNPWDRERAAGGSSGGSAAAVAGRSCWYALGSDTGGSIRLPAAHCGLTGIKPTYGTVSRRGLIAHASSLDQIGPLCKDAADCAAVLDAIRCHDPLDATSRKGAYGRLLENLTEDVRGMRIGLPVDCLGAGVDHRVREAVLAAAEVFSGLGARVEEIRFPVMEYMVPAYYILASAEASSNLARYDGVKFGRRAEEYENLSDLYRKSRSEGFGAEVKRRILLGTFVLSAGYYEAYYQKALRAKALIAEAYREAFSQCDLLLTPVAPATAPRLGEQLTDPVQMYLGDIYTVGANLAGLPALSMPCGRDGSGLPIGAQLVGPALGEQQVLNAAHAFQRATDHHREGAAQ